MAETCTGSNGDEWKFSDSGGEWRWTRTARNGEVVGKSSEGYKNKSDCITNARRPGMDCNLGNDDTCTGSNGDKWEIYKDNAGEWRWRRTSTSNGEIVGAAHEGYKNKADCIANAQRPGMDCDPS